ncbi:hypothetical protein KY092_16460 [Natronomonas gomsonensis]|uniref:hypothetical protein n=1 Tax=Natronomonas gomsonensis TaxID=1046043 RepID=UPI00227D14CC|nr:hypothetical protein [Natronomonas gomsonensis]MCY4732150.1 hypothetical protein [Natronomonas gomsonensis]
MPSPEETNAAAREFLSDHPAAEASLEALLERDARGDPWTFEETELDSGRFGELVSRDLATAVDDGYRLANPEAIEAALDGDAVSGRVEERSTASTPELTLSLAAFDRVATATLAAILALTIVIRASTYRSVFREHVVFPSNDPYAYVYAVERGLESGWSLAELPPGVPSGEPLTAATLLYSVELVGFLDHGVVLAWLPVLAAVVTVAVVYRLAHAVTDDRRVALAAAFVLAVLPEHVMRSALGFVDHHPFDYVWLTITAWGLVGTFTCERLAVDRRTLGSIGLVGVGVAGSVLSWDAAPLLLTPIAVATVVAGAAAVRNEQSFLASGVATVVGLGLGSALVALAHVTWGWHDATVAALPALLTVGVGVLVAGVWLWRRVALPAAAFPVAVGVGLAGLVVVVPRLIPERWAEIQADLTRLFAQRAIAEVQGFFTSATMGWLLTFGIVFFVALPAMVWGAARAIDGARSWAVAASYAWTLLALAAVQIRFAGELAPFLAVFAGLGIVFLASWIDALPEAVSFGGAKRALSVPSRGTAFRIAGVVLLVCGLSIVLGPVSASSLSIPEEQYETAAFLEDHAAEQGYEYPRSYVFSPWSWNRMYNYRVSGESRSYSYAQTHYRPFVTQTDPDQAYDRISGGRADDAYLVTEPFPETLDDPPASAMQSRLHDRFGSRGDGAGGLAHYRALYASDSGDYKAFRVVPGATISGSAASETETVSLATDVEIEGASFSYEREVAVTDGQFRVTVPYPGTYELEGASVDSVTVGEDAVRSGGEVAASG